MTEYLVKPENSTTWHQVRACISPAAHKDTNGRRPPTLYYANFEGAIICSALDDHEIIMIDEGGDILKHYHVSAREYFQELFDREELERSQNV
jgi:hypothetical protein